MGDREERSGSHRYCSAGPHVKRTWGMSCTNLVCVSVRTVFRFPDKGSPSKLPEVLLREANQ